MHKLSCLVFLCFCNTILFSQKTDSVSIFYQSDEFNLTPADLGSLDKFLANGWDKIVIRSYADVTNEDDYNVDLTLKRATEVHKYLASKQVYSKNVMLEYFGESILLADNATGEGRAKNRKTTVIGYQYERKPVVPLVDPARPVTQTLQNGFIVTYRPKYIPEECELDWGSNFELITNTTGMRRANLYNNTTDGDILSSVLIFSGENIINCKLDSPIFLRIPIPYTSCPMDSIRFFVAVSEGGKRIWQEKIMKMESETIKGQRYMGLWLDNFCGTYNFDFKIRQGKCFDIDSVGLITMEDEIKNISAELVGLNSVYLPRQLTGSEYSIWFEKEKFNQANVSFSLYEGKKLLKRFYNQRVSSFPLSAETKKYVLTTDTIRFASAGVKDFFMLLKVNRDVYRKLPHDNAVEFIYLNRANENITVNIYATGKKKKHLEFKNVPLDSIPFNEATGTYIIDAKLLTKLEQTQKEVTKHMVSAR